mgnify:CR=1 FL=1
MTRPTLPADLRASAALLHPQDAVRKLLLAAADELERLQAVVNRVKLACTDRCMCGGKGPGDLRMCDACSIFHAMEVTP